MCVFWIFCALTFVLINVSDGGVTEKRSATRSLPEFDLDVADEPFFFNEIEDDVHCKLSCPFISPMYKLVLHSTCIFFELSNSFIKI